MAFSARRKVSGTNDKHWLHRNRAFGIACGNRKACDARDGYESKSAGGGGGDAIEIKNNYVLSALPPKTQQQPLGPRCSAASLVLCGLSLPGLVLCALHIVGFDGSLERLGVGANHFCNLVAALEQEEGGHGTNPEFFGNIGHLVHVELEETGVGVLVGQPVANRLGAGSPGSAHRAGRQTDRQRGPLLDYLGSDDLAGTAPCGETVEHHERLLLAQRLVEG